MARWIAIRSARLRITTSDDRAPPSYRSLRSGLLFTGISGAAGNELHAVVGPDFTIFLDDGSGARTSHLDPGVYSLTVDDRSDGRTTSISSAPAESTRRPTSRGSG